MASCLPVCLGSLSGLEEKYLQQGGIFPIYRGSSPFVGCPWDLKPCFSRIQHGERSMCEYADPVPCFRQSVSEAQDSQDRPLGGNWGGITCPIFSLKQFQWYGRWTFEEGWCIGAMECRSHPWLQEWRTAQLFSLRLGKGELFWRAFGQRRELEKSGKLVRSFLNNQLVVLYIL